MPSSYCHRDNVRISKRPNEFAFEFGRIVQKIFILIFDACVSAVTVCVDVNVFILSFGLFLQHQCRERASSRKYTFTFVYLFIFFFCRFRFLFCAVCVAAAFVVVDAVCLFGSVCFVEMGVRQTYTIEILFSMLLSRFNSKYIGIENGRKFSSLYALIAIGFTHQMVMLI